MPIKSKNPKKIVEQILKEFKKKKLHIGKSKKKVTSKKQALAIAMHLARKKGKKKKGK